MHWYFAYGSNMLRAQMISRTGAAEPARVCRLPDYRLAFNKRHVPTEAVVANIVPSPGDEVWGVAYHCTPQAIRTLDLWENVRQDSYRHLFVEVRLPQGARLRALAYIGSPDSLCEGLAPSAEYLDRIVNGAREHGLPGAYVASITRCVDGGTGRQAHWAGAAGSL